MPRTVIPCQGSTTTTRIPWFSPPPAPLVRRANAHTSLAPLNRNWPKCAKVIGDIRDQSMCGCCWAFAGAEAASDRLCIATNGTVAVPNNVTNLSRALYLLQANGLITLKPGFNDASKDQATPKDIAENPKHLKILEIESPQIPRALEDVDLAVINGNFALEAGLQPAKDALGLEKAQGNPYANILVTTPKLAQDPRIQQLAKDLRSPAVAKFISEKYAGSVIPVALE